MKIKKRILSLALCVFMAVSAFPVSVRAVPLMHDISQDSVTLSSCGDYCPGHTISGSTAEHTVTVVSGEHYITFDNVDINVSGIEYAAAVSLGKDTWVELTLKGTNVVKSGAMRAGIVVPETAALAVTGEDNATLEAVGGDDGAGIGGELYLGRNSAGTILISGGMVTASGGAGSAGIGGGTGGSGGSITIKNSVVTAMGLDMGAGIGGGYGGDSGSIKITDSTVIASGYRDTSSDNLMSGAGIGGGYGGNCESVAITKSNVIASSTEPWGGAGIGGGGETGFGGTITIAESNVMAVGSADTAGIGGSGSFSITITDGITAAFGGYGSAGIGASGGYGAVEGRIYIDGGVVAAISGDTGAGIGGGGTGSVWDITITGNSQVTAAGGTTGPAVTVPDGKSLEDIASNCIIFDGSSEFEGKTPGAVYGEVTLASDLVINAESILSVPDNAVLKVPQGITLSGEITGGGSVQNTGGTTILTCAAEDGSLLVRVTLPEDSGEANIDIPVDFGDEAGTVVCFITDAATGEINQATGEYADGSINITVPGNCTVEIFAEVQTEPPFSDIEPGSWYYDSVVNMYDMGIMDGTEGSRFDPGLTTSRSMLVAMLWRLDGEPAVAEEMTMPFFDIPSDAWYKDALLWASNFIVDGYGDGNFGPDDPITREQMAVMLWRYAKYCLFDTSAGKTTYIGEYNDAADVSGWAEEAVKWACGTGIINGKDGALLDPQGETTRAEAAVMMERFILWAIFG